MSSVHEGKKMQEIFVNTEGLKIVNVNSIIDNDCNDIQYDLEIKAEQTRLGNRLID